MLDNLPDDRERGDTAAPPDRTRAFDLTYRNTVIGHLEVADGEWLFRYSDGFRSNPPCVPLVDFPKSDQIYSSRRLWPCFAVRIPGTGQPAVRAVLEAEGIDPADEAAMLERLGTRCLTNPFVLRPMPTTKACGR